MKPAAPTLLDATGRVAFVTGATGGIGQSVVRMMLEAGAKVAATGRRAVPFNHDHVLPLTLDVTDEDAIEDTIHALRDDKCEIMEPRFGWFKPL